MGKISNLNSIDVIASELPTERRGNMGITINSDVLHEDERLLMLIRLFRMACNEWGRSILECADIFEKHGVDEYITDCYEMFHVQGDDANLEDIEEYLSERGEIV